MVPVRLLEQVNLVVQVVVEMVVLAVVLLDLVIKLLVVVLPQHKVIMEVLVQIHLHMVVPEVAALVVR